MKTQVEALVDAAAEFRAAAAHWAWPAWSTSVLMVGTAKAPRIAVVVEPAVALRPGGGLDAEPIARGDAWVRARAGWRMVLGDVFELRYEVAYEVPAGTSRGNP